MTTRGARKGTSRAGWARATLGALLLFSPVALDAAAGPCTEREIARGSPEIDAEHERRFGELNEKRDRCIAHCTRGFRFQDSCGNQCNYEFNVALGVEEDRVLQARKELAEEAAAACSEVEASMPQSTEQPVNPPGPEGGGLLASARALLQRVVTH